MLNKKKNNKGFTLVELLVVIAIIGILAVVAVPALFKNIEKAKVADLEADISAIKSATISYVTDNNLLPIDIATTGAADGNAAAIKVALGENLDSISNPYKANYTIDSTPGEDGKVVLTITTPSAMSSDSITKLNADLASMKDGNTAIASGTTVTVLLMKGPGLAQKTQ